MKLVSCHLAVKWRRQYSNSDLLLFRNSQGVEIIHAKGKRVGGQFLRNGVFDLKRKPTN